MFFINNKPKALLILNVHNNNNEVEKKMVIIKFGYKFCHNHEICGRCGKIIGDDGDFFIHLSH